MKKQLFFTPKGGLMEKPMVIMLSGLPCTGKTTWREQFIKEAQSIHVPTTVICADDIAFQMRDELNASKAEGARVTYSDVCETYREQLNQQCKNELLKAMIKPGIVLLDRTYLTPERRREVIELIHSDSLHCVHFVIQDKQAWQDNLQKRNDSDNEKKITAEIIERLNKGASLPHINEGFESIKSCLAIGEKNWQETAISIIHDLMKVYQERQDSLNPLNESPSFSE